MTTRDQSTAPRRGHRSRRIKDDGGFALLSVLAGMSVLLVILTAVLTYSTNSLKDVRQTERTNSAFAAAEAGVNDYLARLNGDDNYWTRSSHSAPTASTFDCANVALRVPRTDNLCGWKSNTAPGWVNVPGSARGQFHYEVNTSSTYTTGTVVLTSTGRVDKSTRTVQVRLRRSGFGEFLYYTVYETVDPANEAVYGVNNATAADKCAHYFWEPNAAPSKPRDTSYCSDINFISGDVIDGPLHTNDAMLIQGKPTFNGTTTTSYPTCKPVDGVKPPASKCYRPGTGAAPNFNKGIAYRPEVQLPESVADLRRYVDPAKTAKPGCLYTGPTRIRINQNASGAASTMTVWSKYSKGTLNPGCGNASASWPQELPIPHNNIILVQDVPASQNTPATGACPTSNGGIGDGYPQSGDLNQNLRESDCRYGTVYLEGTLKGRLTIAADNNILVTGPITYSGGTRGTDALGLIASNSVKVYHPVACTNYSNNRCTAYTNMKTPNGAVNSDVALNAAVLTLQHSFTVQLYQYGAPLGKLSLFGTIAQKYRGPVGTTKFDSNNNPYVATGFVKNYVYDTRLRFAPPPFFLDPVRAAWDVKTFGELQAQYR